MIRSIVVVLLVLAPQIVSAQTGFIKISSVPASVMIRINGVIEGRTDKSITKELDVGTYDVSASQEGYVSASKSVVISTDELEEITFQLVRMAEEIESLANEGVVEVTAKLGHLIFVSMPPELEIVVDGYSKGITPLRIRNYPVGAHPISVGRGSTEIIVKEDSVTRVRYIDGQFAISFEETTEQRERRLLLESQAQADAQRAAAGLIRREEFLTTERQATLLASSVPIALPSINWGAFDTTIRYCASSKSICFVRTDSTMLVSPIIEDMRAQIVPRTDYIAISTHYTNLDPKSLDRIVIMHFRATSENESAIAEIESVLKAMCFGGRGAVPTWGKVKSTFVPQEYYSTLDAILFPRLIVGSDGSVWSDDEGQFVNERSSVGRQYHIVRLYDKQSICD